MIRAAIVSLALSVMMAPGGASGQGAPDASLVPPEKPVAKTQASAEAPELSKTPPEADAPSQEAPEVAAPPEPLAPSAWQTLQETNAALVSCLGTLNELGAVYKLDDPRTGDDRDCGIANPVRLTQPVQGIEIDTPALMRCETAAALGTWLRDFVQPAAATLKRGPVVKLTKGSGYDCRGRNNQPDGKLSEHAYGNAIDIMAFRFKDGSQIKVAPRARDGTLAESFQDAVRATACLHFTTVLGPGSDDSHSDHLHLDVIARQGGFRLCQ
ncbi:MULTISPECIES: extensin family protein [Roseobacteraceae]|jgi:hypothetical protein|uniref:Extensin n=1 Tax=Pseudosulfitobacter pseudonitzschiae TaxID=1402135 RepID=A0A221JYZ8_9RHOB|nr:MULTISPECIES: extensin family protein [Roseobacteraceae]ASM71958.1 extensin [Pseudosulfitobacter pseudonitzschiae]